MPTWQPFETPKPSPYKKKCLVLIVLQEKIFKFLFLVSAKNHLFRKDLKKNKSLIFVILLVDFLLLLEKKLFFSLDLLPAFFWFSLSLSLCLFLFLSLSLSLFVSFFFSLSLALSSFFLFLSHSLSISILNSNQVFPNLKTKDQLYL